MADETSGGAQAVSGGSAGPSKPAQPAAAAPAEEKRTREEWVARARSALGESPHIVYGALSHLEAEAHVAEAEVRQHLEDFSKRSGV